MAESESRTSSESRLKVRPSTATLRSRSEPPSRAFSPFTRNSGTVSCTRDTASSIPGALERSSEKAKSLRRQAPAVSPGAAMPPRGYSWLIRSITSKTFAPYCSHSIIRRLGSANWV